MKILLNSYLFHISFYPPDEEDGSDDAEKDEDGDTDTDGGSWAEESVLDLLWLGDDELDLGL